MFFFIVCQRETMLLAHFQIYRIVLSINIGLIRPGSTQTGCTRITCPGYLIYKTINYFIKVLIKSHVVNRFFP